MAIKKDALLIPIAKLYFMITGYVFQIVIARLLTKSLIGMFNYVNSVISPVNMILVQGGVQTASHFVSRASPEEIGNIKKKILKLFVSFSISLFIILQLLADKISEIITKDTQNSIYFRIAIIIVLLYSVYAVLIGIFNGRKQFKNQALFDMTYSTLKVFLVSISLFMGFKLYGLLWAWVVATIIITVLAYLFSVNKQTKGENSLKYKDIVKFSLPIIISQLFFYILLNLDTWMLGILSTKKMVLLNGGNYLTITTLARIPYQIVISITFIIFPFISNLSQLNDKKSIKSYIETSLRYSILIAAPFVILISAYPSIFLKVIYGQAFVENSVYLSILVVGVLFLALFMINITIITASGKPIISMFITIVVIPIEILLNYILVARYSLYGVVIATSISFFISWILSSLYVFFIYKAFLPIKTFIRFVLIFLLFHFVFQVFRDNLNILQGIFSLIIGGVFIYLAFFLLFEFRKKDFDDLKAMFKKKHNVS
jgi:stage V sporulation protein B